jgi:hypothetical protein
MLRALRTSGKRFCEQSGAWRQNLTPITTVANQLYYTVVNTWSADITGIARVGARIAVEIAKDADADGTEISSGSYVYQPDTKRLKFSQAPATSAVTNGLMIKAVLVPNFNSSEIAEWFISLYTDAIIGGAIAEICGMPALYNREKQRDGQKMFNNGLARAAHDVATGYGARPHQMQGGYSLL